MKIIILEGIATMGKTCLGYTLTDFLTEEKAEHQPVYFNDEIRSKYGLDTLSLKKDPKIRENLTTQLVKDSLSDIIEKLEEIEKKDNQKYLYLIDRLHYSYMESLKAEPKDFLDFENKIRDFSYYICLNLEKPTPDLLYSRIKSSLELRKDHPFTLRHFKRLVGDETSEEIQKNLIWSHYGPKIEKYNSTFDKTTLNKKMLFVDKIIHKEDYSKLLTDNFKDELRNFRVA